MVSVPAAGSPGSSGSSTRERLVAAAIQVFVAEGYEQARLQDIARTAGMTTGAIYANYRGKEDLLFDAIGTRAHAETEALLHDRDGHDARELLGILGDQLLKPRAEPSLLLDAVAAARRDDKLAGLLRARLTERQELLSRLVEAGKRDGTIDPALDTIAITRLCLTLALGALAVRALDLEGPDPRDWHVLVGRLLDACAPRTVSQTAKEKS